MLECKDGCEPFLDVDVRSLTAWIAAIPFEEWPQQSKTELKPAMVTDQGWHDFGTMARPIMEAVTISLIGVPDHFYNPMLSVVMPGHSIEPHKDEQGANWLIRVHVPLLTNAKAFYEVEGKPFNLKVGKAYKINTLLEHAVRNDGKTPRIHLMWDVRKQNA